MSDVFALGKVEEVGKETMVYTTLDWSEISKMVEIIGYWPY